MFHPELCLKMLLLNNNCGIEVIFISSDELLHTRYTRYCIDTYFFDFKGGYIVAYIYYVHKEKKEKLTSTYDLSEKSSKYGL